jgi:ATP-binding cassette subfamily C (CFTR/MRP) protein 1
MRLILLARLFNLTCAILLFCWIRKTSLIMALLGQINRVKGSQRLSARVAYAGQEHWIQNLTVKDNVLFDSLYGEDEYGVVMDAAQLSKDLLTLPNGDLTEIGERGINLSGGQKARVNIARALYAPDSNLFVFDDPLSAVDVHVGKAIFTGVIQEMLDGCACIVVFSSNYHFLPFFSKIIVVEKNGLVNVCQSYDKLKQKFPQFLSQDGEEAFEKSKIESFDDNADPSRFRIPSKRELMSGRFGSETESIKASSPNKGNMLTRGKSIFQSMRHEMHAPHGSSSNSATMTEEDREKGVVSAETFGRYFSASLEGKGIRGGGVVVLVLMTVFAIGQAFRVLSDLFIGVWAKDPSRHPKSVNYIVYSVIVFLSTMFVILRSIFFIMQCLAASRTLHDNLLRKVLSAPINTYFDVTPIGRILNRFSKDLDSIDSNLPDFFLNMLQNSFHVISVLALCLSSTPYFVIILVPLAILFYFVQNYFRKTSRELKRLEAVSRSPMYTLFGELLVGLSTVRAFRREEIFMRKFNSICDKNNRFFFMFWMCSRWLALRLDLISSLVVLSVAVIAVLMKQYGSSVNSYLLGVSLVFSLQLAGLLQWTVRTVIETENNMTSVERLLAFNNIESEKVPEIDDQLPGESWPQSGAIEMRNVRLRYRPGLPEVLKGVNFVIPGGTKVGVCGRTGELMSSDTTAILFAVTNAACLRVGAGKSSLMLALFRIVEPEEGSEICIDGVDILNISLNTLRSKLTIIPQASIIIVACCEVFNVAILFSI